MRDFAVADRLWVRYIAFARIYDDDHWTSDAIAGAAIGALVGRAVAGTNIAERRNGA